MSRWTIYVHDDGEYLSIRRDDQRGDTLLKMPEGHVDHATVVAFVEAARAALDGEQQP